MSTAHTPGPWDIVPRLTASENHKGFRIWRDGHGFIADVSPRNEANGDPSVEGIANSNLIAAAPDLLAALMECESYDSEGVLPSKKLREMVEAAIAKATGAQS